MEEFNVFTPALYKGIKKSKSITILAKRGNEAIFINNLFNVYSRDKAGNLSNSCITLTDIKSRKLESQRLTDAEVFIHDSSTHSLSWSGVYKNTRGAYFKKQGSKYYL